MMVYSWSSVTCLELFQKYLTLLGNCIAYIIDYSVFSGSLKQILLMIDIKSFKICDMH